MILGSILLQHVKQDLQLSSTFPCGTQILGKPLPYFVVKKKQSPVIMLNHWLLVERQLRTPGGGSSGPCDSPGDPLLGQAYLPNNNVAHNAGENVPVLRITESAQAYLFLKKKGKKIIHKLGYIVTRSNLLAVTILVKMYGGRSHEECFIHCLGS